MSHRAPSDFDYSDVVPIPPPQEPGDPFYVEYTRTHSMLFSVFNSLISIPELSLRALALCDEILQRFPGHYTAWWYRFRILESLGYDPSVELAFVQELITTNPKLYQGWHYRKWLVDRFSEAPDEGPLLRASFAQDSKNFHGWTYAVWYAERWDKRQEVFELAREEIAKDCRNNSAWTVRRTLGIALGVDPVLEFEEAVESLRIVGRNEAAANFLLAVVQGNSELVGRIRPIGEELFEKQSDNRFALMLLLFVAKDQAEVTRICDLLISVDPLRRPYYTLVKQGVIKPF
jgi:protein farnesyltransferase/geranylgeranyltransferase type-1 subunit alpha